MVVETAWRRLAYPRRDGLIALRIELVTSGLPHGIAQLSYLGRGTMPPALLQLEATYLDRTTLAVPELPPADGPAAADNLLPAMPVAARLSVHVWDPVARDRWPLDDVDAAADEWATTVVVAPETPLELPATGRAVPVARFANGLDLYGPPHAPAAGPLELWWHATRDLDQELSALVHVVRGDDRVGVFDRAPATHGTLPTQLWRAGDVIVAHYTTGGVAGDVILFGLYDAASGTRVGVATPAGEPWPDNVVRFEVQR
jgi:hypothetical protein